jgi:DNA-directed RNA polymerase specialized sigma24 family protein
VRWTTASRALSGPAASITCGSPWCSRATGIPPRTLVQASLVKLYRAWPRLDTASAPDAYLHRIMVNTHRSRRMTTGQRLAEIIGAFCADAVTLNRRTYSPAPRQSDLRADTAIPWWQNRRPRFQFT